MTEQISQGGAIATIQNIFVVRIKETRGEFLEIRAYLKEREYLNGLSSVLIAKIRRDDAKEVYEQIAELEKQFEPLIGKEVALRNQSRVDFASVRSLIAAPQTDPILDNHQRVSLDDERPDDNRIPPHFRDSLCDKCAKSISEPRIWNLVRNEKIARHNQPGPLYGQPILCGNFVLFPNDRQPALMEYWCRSCVEEYRMKSFSYYTAYRRVYGKKPW